MTDPLVSADWLADHLEEVVVLDATYFLPPDPARSQAEFRDAHIPGARLFEIDEVSDHDHPLPHMMPDPATFSQAMAALGIDGSKPVVVYDRSPNHFSAPRVWFTLRAFGLAESYVLDGGLALWQAGGHPVAEGSRDAEPVAPRDWSLEAGRVLTAAEVADEAEAATPILDARSAERFEGRAPEPRPGLSSGHMPGSRCAPFTALTGEDGRFRTADELAPIFAGIEEVEPVVTCGSGMTACVLALGLARLGRKARLYDGSWAEWGTGTVGPILNGADSAA